MLFVNLVWFVLCVLLCCCAVVLFHLFFKKIQKTGTLKNQPQHSFTLRTTSACKRNCLQYSIIVLRYGVRIKREGERGERVLTKWDNMYFFVSLIFFCIFFLLPAHSILNVY